MKYKIIKKSVPWCEKGNHEIRGNGSMVTPYWCDCGLWEYDHDANDYLLNGKNETKRIDN
jgi:hypothetical protein